MEYVNLEMPKAGDTVFVGMSGGVDSTLTAMLLKERGCHVYGATMSLYKGDLPQLPENLNSCYGPNEAVNIDECKKFCEENGIEYFVIDVKEAYQREVLEYFKSEYRCGRTPNPCIRCNPLVKFGALIEGIKKLNIPFDYFCTGHYAKLVRGNDELKTLYKNTCAEGGNLKPVQVTSAFDVTKDQSYFLYRIPSEILEKVRFPLAEYTKKEVFEMAKARGLKASERKESQDFIPPQYLDHIFSDKPSVPGNFIDFDGKVLGKHKGIEHYTIGQRRGLGVSASEPLYVAEINKDDNVIVLGKDSDLFSKGLIADDIVWPGNFDPDCEFDAMVKIRLASKPVMAHLSPYKALNGENFKGNAYKIIFQEKQRAVAPGQSVVFYIDGITCGGGLIYSSIKD